MRKLNNVVAIGVVAIGTCLLGVSPAAAQFVGSVRQSPFVIATIPVVSNGAVGGVSIDAEGIVTNPLPAAGRELEKLRSETIARQGGSLDKPSSLRNISLRRLEAAIRAHGENQPALPTVMQYLAGLTRVRYVLVYPDLNDIVLAGTAEPFAVDELGNVVGKQSAAPLLRLDDLVTALRAADAGHAAEIRCSIDPTAEGLARFQQAVPRTAAALTPARLAQLEQSLGPQVITLAGVPGDSHFARVMVAADYRMKRLAMALDDSPVAGLDSYLQLAAADGRAAASNLMPRWWLAPNYEPVRHSQDLLAWEIRGPGLQVLTEASRLAATGELQQTGQASPAARKWAEQFGSKYEALSRALPVFGELRNCVDLAVVAAIIIRHDLLTEADYEPPLLLDAEQLSGEVYFVPQQVASQAGLIRSGRNVALGVSGGVEINARSVADRTHEDAGLLRVRSAGQPPAEGGWWWDQVAIDN